MARKIEKIRLNKSESEVREDLKKYQEKALALGATRAKIVSASDIPVDDRVPLKCQIPRCFGYGTSAHCPPNTLKPQELREHLKDYHRALFFIKEVPSAVIIRDRKTIKERIDA